MADKNNFGISEESEKEEHFDSKDCLASKLDQLAEWVKDAHHLIIFTGAGISTSTGIPDFRSGMNTVLPTGPGAWELRDKGLAAIPRKTKTTSVLKAIPSASHMAIVKLHQCGILKFLVSQNTDGLHLRSGMNPMAMSELHGNTNLEICVKCGARYLRDFRTRTSRNVHDHFTGRSCDEVTCNGRLKDSIINFGEDLPEKDLMDAYLHADEADVCIALGSSLRVTPACDIPRNVGRNGKLVIGNLQKTPLDSKASLTINAFCDDIMVGLMERLELAIPKWELSRRVQFAIITSSRPMGKRLKITVNGLHPNKNTPYSIFQKVQFTIDCDGESTTKEVKKEPFAFAKTVPLTNKSINITCTLTFHGHYGEPPLTIGENCLNDSDSFRKEYNMFYDPAERKWRFS